MEHRSGLKHEDDAGATFVVDGSFDGFRGRAQVVICDRLKSGGPFSGLASA
ncbi:hypothetical protein [Saliniramus sp.]|uniref:hypothetical protein n=1 Tax=Saliniramus sp. TaxID=2986772 RepID=UPI002BC40B07|nr:hypothetical protein [Saliniramus sp.]HMB11769.1 hypothetical protein [Saliniramus sp.]